MKKIVAISIFCLFCVQVMALDAEAELSDGETLEINEFFLTNGVPGVDPDGRVHGVLYEPEEGASIMWLTLFIEWKEVADLHPVDIVVLDPHGEKVYTHKFIVANSWFFHAFPIGFDLTKHAAGKWTFEAWELGRLIGTASAEVVEKYEDLSFYGTGKPLVTYDPNLFTVETDTPIVATYRYSAKINEQGKVYEVELVIPTGHEKIDNDIREVAWKQKFIPIEGIGDSIYVWEGSFEILPIKQE